MNKSTLTLGEIYTLETELSGVFNQQTGERLTKGLLGQNISLLQKYWLTDLQEEVNKIKKPVDTLRNELIQKLGTPGENGSVSIPVTIDKKDSKGKVIQDENGEPIKILNPKFQEFNQEIEKLFAESREIEHYSFKIADFDLKTDESYPVFFKLIKQVKDEPAK